MDDDLDAMDGGEAAGGGRGLLIVLAFAGVLGVAAVAGRSLLDPGPGPSGDGSAGAVIADGKRLYEARCSSCHGKAGRGDGPLAPSLRGPGPGDLTDDDWKHGDRPDRVLAVIAEGVPGTSMPGYDSAFDDRELRALAAYMYRLAGRDVPEELLGPAIGG